MSFRDDLGLDSLDEVELLLDFERVFEIAIPKEAAEKLRTVGDVITLIESAVGEKKPATNANNRQPAGQGQKLLQFPRPSNPLKTGFPRQR